MVAEYGRVRSNALVWRYSAGHTKFLVANRAYSPRRLQTAVGQIVSCSSLANGLVKFTAVSEFRAWLTLLFERPLATFRFVRTNWVPSDLRIHQPVTVMTKPPNPRYGPDAPDPPALICSRLQVGSTMRGEWHLAVTPGQLASDSRPPGWRMIWPSSSSVTSSGETSEAGNARSLINWSSAIGLGPRRARI